MHTGVGGLCKASRQLLQEIYAVFPFFFLPVIYLRLIVFKRMPLKNYPEPR